MKIALCFSGHLRTYKSVLGSWRCQFIDVYNPDVFVHTWDVAGLYIPPVFAMLPSEHKGTVEITNTPIDLEYVYSTLQPKECIVESYSKHEAEFIRRCSNWIEWRDTFAPNASITNCHPHPMLSQLYKLWAVTKLTKVYNYDIIICARPDLLLDDPFPVEYLNPEYFWVNKCDDAGVYIDDIIKAGSPINIYRYANLYHELDILFEKAQSENRPFDFFSIHSIQYLHCRRNEIPLVAHPFPGHLLR
jgi:hypothetical protein